MATPRRQAVPGIFAVTRLTCAPCPHTCPASARWRSGDAEDCKTTANRQKSAIVRSFTRLFTVLHFNSLREQCELLGGWHAPYPHPLAQVRAGCRTLPRKRQKLSIFISVGSLGCHPVPEPGIGRGWPSAWKGDLEGRNGCFLRLWKGWKGASPFCLWGQTFGSVKFRLIQNNLHSRIPRFTLPTLPNFYLEYAALKERTELSRFLRSRSRQKWKATC